MATSFSSKKGHILIGTSGYSYNEWVDAGFYPSGTRPNQMLELYARRFSVTELNFTWYQTPRAEALEKMQQRTPGRFQFAVKLNRSLTHEVDSGAWREQARRFREGVSPFVLSGRLLTILIQLPPFFDRSPQNRRYLAELVEELEGLPLSVEFRHASWAADQVFGELEKRRITLVSVDEPELPDLFPKLDIVTNPDLFYLRFHGRNTKGWRSGNMMKKFDYSYTDDELREWTDYRLGSMAQKADKGVVFFNNHVRAQAPENAERMKLLLEQETGVQPSEN